MSIITRLTAWLNTNTTEFEAGFKGASRTMNTFQRDASKVSTAVTAAFTALTTGALASFIIKQAKVIDQTNDLAKSLGINIRELQALQRVAEESGVSTEGLTAALTRTQKAIAEAAQGSKSYQQAFKAIGLTTAELVNLKPEDQFKAIATGLSQIENPTQRTALALELFGKQGRAIIAMLDQFPEKFKEAAEFNDRFNISLNSIDAAKVDEAGDTMARVGAAIGGLGNTIAVEVSPVVTALGESFLNAGADGEKFTKIVTYGLEGIAAAVDIVRLYFAAFDLAVSAVTESFAGLADTGARGLDSLQQKVVSVINKIPGVSIEASKSIEGLAVSTGYVADAAKDDFDSIVKGLEGYEFTIDKIKREQAQANERAAKAGPSLPGGGAPFEGFSTEAADKAKEKIDSVTKSLQFNIEQLKRSNTEQQVHNNLKQAGIGIDTDAGARIAELTRAYENQQDTLEQQTKVFDSLGSSGKTFFRDLTSGSKSFGESLSDLGNRFVELFEDMIIFEPLEKMFRSSFSSGGGGAGGLLGSIGSLFSIPSFATGTDFVSRDTLARVHRGEAIVPASQVGGMGAGGNVTVNVVNNAGAEVSTKQQQTGNGTEITMIIDQVVSEKMNTSGSKINQAMKNFGNRTRIQR